jgi:PAS domain S-box-containing protein
MDGAELRLFIEQAPMAVAMFDRDMRYVAISNRWLAERGIDRSIIGRNAYEVYPDISQEWRDLHQRALAGETLFRDEDRLATPHGDVDWARWAIRPWRTAGGEVGGIVIYAENITRRKGAEEALRESSERLALAQSVANIAIWDWNVVTGAAWVNEEYRVICNLPPESAPTYESFLAQLVPEDREAYDAAVRAALAGEADIDTECRIIGALDGELRWLRSKGKIFFDEAGAPTRAMGALWDITAIKQAQRALLEKSEARYRRIVETSLEGICLINATGKILFANPRMADLLGWTPDDMLGHSLLDYIDGEWQALAQQKMATRDASALSQEFSFRRKDGSTLWALLSCRPIHEDGLYTGSLAMIMDFTEQKHLQDELQASFRQLKESDRRKNEFLATLAHELRNPLATISLAVEKLGAHLQPGVIAAANDQAALARVGRQTRHLSRLVDELLQVSRINSGKIDLHHEVCDLVALIPEAVALAQPKIDEKGMEFVVSLPTEPLFVFADPVRLVQVFGNLLDNAAKFTAARGRIEVTAKAVGASALVAVRDNGVGLAPDQLSSAFELFRQMKHGQNRNSEGLGIGLALARRLVELHGGEILAKSEGEGRGSEFSVRLPLWSATPAGPHAKAG